MGRRGKRSGKRMVARTVRGKDEGKRKRQNAQRMVVRW